MRNSDELPQPRHTGDGKPADTEFSYPRGEEIEERILVFALHSAIVTGFVSLVIGIFLRIVGYKG